MGASRGAFLRERYACRQYDSFFSHKDVMKSRLLNIFLLNQRIVEFMYLNPIFSVFTIINLAYSPK